MRRVVTFPVSGRVRRRVFVLAVLICVTPALTGCIYYQVGTRGERKPLSALWSDNNKKEKTTAAETRQAKAASVQQRAQENNTEIKNGPGVGGLILGVLSAYALYKFGKWVLAGNNSNSSSSSSPTYVDDRSPWWKCRDRCQGNWAGINDCLRRRSGDRERCETEYSIVHGCIERQCGPRPPGQ